MGRKSKLPLILEALRSSTGRDRGLTRQEVQVRTGVSRAAVNAHLYGMHAQRMVYVHGWVTDAGGIYQARFRLGDRQDMPKPPRMPSAEAARRFRQRAIKTGVIEDIRANDRVRYWRQRPARRDPLAAALFGGFTAANDSSNRESA